MGLDHDYDTVLTDITRDKRERKAVKADDADIPEYLWEEHMVEGRDEQTWDATKLVKMRRVATWLRSKMLSRWKRNVTTSYTDWAEAKYDLKDVKTSIDWVTWNGVGYEWSPKDGRMNYSSWWKRRLLVTHQDCIPARDAIYRAAKTTWWCW
jgi:hypothetical protein